MAAISLEDFDALGARDFLQRHHSLAPATPRSLYLGYEIESDLGNSGLQDSYAVRLRTEFPESEEAERLRGGEL